MRKNKANRVKRRNNYAGYLFIAPHLLSVILFLFVPLLYSLFISFYDFNLFKGFTSSVFIGLDNYRKLFTDRKVLISIVNNLKYMLGTIPVTLCLSMVLAVFLNDRVYLKNALRTVFFLPYIASVAAMGMVWMRIFSPTMGLINGLLASAGVSKPPGWLSSETWALPTLMIIAVWGTLGYNIVIYMSGLQSIDRSLYESADIDGASFLQKIRYIIVPLLTPTTFFLVITSIISSFQVFGSINIMTKGGPGDATYVIAYYTYTTAFSNYKMGYASAMSWLLIAIIFVITVIQWKGQNKWVNY